LQLFFVEYDKLMAEGGTGDYFFIRYVQFMFDMYRILVQTEMQPSQ